VRCYGQALTLPPNPTFHSRRYSTTHLLPPTATYSSNSSSSSSSLQAASAADGQVRGVSCHPLTCLPPLPLLPSNLVWWARGDCLPHQPILSIISTRYRACLYCEICDVCVCDDVCLYACVCERVCWIFQGRHVAFLSLFCHF